MNTVFHVSINIFDRNSIDVSVSELFEDINDALALIRQQDEKVKKEWNVPDTDTGGWIITRQEGEYCFIHYMNNDKYFMASLTPKRVIGPGCTFVAPAHSVMAINDIPNTYCTLIDSAFKDAEGKLLPFSVRDIFDIYTGEPVGLIADYSGEFHCVYDAETIKKYREVVKKTNK